MICLLSFVEISIFCSVLMICDDPSFAFLSKWLFPLQFALLAWMTFLQNYCTLCISISTWNHHALYCCAIYTYYHALFTDTALYITQIKTSKLQSTLMHNVHCTYYCTKHLTLGVALILASPGCIAIPFKNCTPTLIAVGRKDRFWEREKKKRNTVGLCVHVNWLFDWCNDGGGGGLIRRKVAVQRMLGI